MATTLKIRSLCCSHLIIRATATTLILVLLVSTGACYSASLPPLPTARQVEWPMQASSLPPKVPSVVASPNHNYIVPSVMAKSSPSRGALFFYPTNYRMMMTKMTTESEGHSPGMGHKNPPSALSSSSSSSSIMPQMYPPMRLSPRP